MRTTNTLTVLFSSSLLILACSSSNSGDGAEGTGGKAYASSGGATTANYTGGAPGNSGGTHTGGAAVSGGAPGTTSSVATGGTTGVGGTMTTGGATSDVGTTMTGGTSAMGGIGAIGGTHAAGGTNDAGETDAGTDDAGGPTPEQLRGKYLVTSVLNCGGCHTPTGGALLSGTDCFVKSGTSGCLSSANLTNDETGIKDLTDQQVKDAFTKGMDPDGPGSYLFANMPYYQFGNLSDADADAIVAFLRTVPGVTHQVQANTAPFDVQPTAPEWAAVDPAALPAATTQGAANGKYLATLACVTCHTVEKSGASPRVIDALKAFQGGKAVNATVNGATKTVQTSNLTPDATGIMAWSAAQVATAITTDKDINGITICGMRALANMTLSDATDIGTYLVTIPPVANPITQTCQ